MQDAGCWMLDAGCKLAALAMLDKSSLCSRYWMQARCARDAGCRLAALAMLDAGSLRSLILDAGCWR
jgi:hypothetical protein